MQHSAASDLGLHCLPMSHKKDARLIRVNLNRLYGPQREKTCLPGVCEHRHRPACASAQSDQCLCYSLFGKYHM